MSRARGNGRRVGQSKNSTRARSEPSSTRIGRVLESYISHKLVSLRSTRVARTGGGRRVPACRADYARASSRKGNSSLCSRQVCEWCECDIIPTRFARGDERECSHSSSPRVKRDAGTRYARIKIHSRDVLMVFLSVKMMHISMLARHLRDARLGFWFVPKTRELTRLPRSPSGSSRSPRRSAPQSRSSRRASASPFRSRPRPRPRSPGTRRFRRSTRGTPQFASSLR